MTVAIESRGLLDQVRQVASRIEEHREAAERERMLPRALVGALRDAGLFQAWLPSELGGREVSLPDFVDAVEAISTLDGATGWVFANIAAAGHLAAFLPESGARRIFADPMSLSAGASAPKGRAVPVDGGYRLSGQWNLASGCHHANWLSGGALIFDGDMPRFMPGGEPDLRFFFFPASDASIIDTWHSTGLRGTGSADIAVSDIFVPDDCVIAFFTSQPWTSGALYRIGILPLFSTALTAVNLGVARAALNAFSELAQRKTPAMSVSPLVARSTVHAEVARAEALMQSARAYFREVAAELMADVERDGVVSEQTEARRRLTAVMVSESCVEAVGRVHRLAGASSIYAGNRIEQCVRDIQTASQHLFFSPVWWEKTGQYYLGQGLGMP